MVRARGRVRRRILASKRALPTTSEAWLEVANEFSNRWNFHRTIGSIDGKYIAIRCSWKSSSYYYNYQGFYSIMLMEVLMQNTAYCMLTLHGTNGTCSDRGVFKEWISTITWYQEK